MTRSLKQQFGLAPLDDVPEHYEVGGNRLTRVITPGGHSLETQQPGLPTYHRRIGNPFPLFAICVGGTFLQLGALTLNLRGLQSTQIWLTTALPLCGIGGITAMMFAFVEGNTFLATSAGSLAGLVGGSSMVFLPWTGITASYIIAAEGNILAGTVDFLKAFGIVLICAAVPVFIITLASFKTAVPIAFSTLLVCITLFLAGAANLRFPALTLQHASGGLCMVIGISLLFSALSVLLTEEGIHIIPVMPLPRLD